MKSDNQSYMKTALKRLFSNFEKKKLKKATLDDIENLEKQALVMILGNEEQYGDYVENKINELKEAFKNNQQNQIVATSENALAKMHNPNMKLNRNPVSNKAKAIGTTAALLVVSLSLTSCGGQDSKSQENNVVVTQSQEYDGPVETTVPEVIEPQSNEAEDMQEYVDETVAHTIEGANSLLSHGVALIDKDLTEEQQKEIIAQNSLMYYVVANIDDITPEEYMNFMHATHGNVIDNDDMTYSFRNMNVLLCNQVLVSNTDNMIDFATFYQNEMDAQLLNDGAAILARYNEAKTKKEKQAISKEFYDYVDSIFNNDLSKLKYSNSALATFINAEFKAWQELTEAENFTFKTGTYADDELVARVLTTICDCGMSDGEKQELDVMDDTKTSLERINVIRIAETLNDRMEMASLDNITYFDFASYGAMKSLVIEGIDLTNYVALESFAERVGKETTSAPAVTHSNDSGVSNGQGGTIAQSEFDNRGIDSSSSTARQEYEAAVIAETEDKFAEESVTYNNNGQVVDPEQLATWAQQGAIDANNGTYNSDVPDVYKDAYQSGFDAAIEAIIAAENAASQSATNYEKTDEVIVDQQESITQDNFTNLNNNTESTVKFVPVESVVIEETSSEQVSGFMSNAQATRVIDVHAITRDIQLQELYGLRKELNDAAQSAIQDANAVMSSLEAVAKTK